MKKGLLALYIVVYFNSLICSKVDLIIYSFDRPLQLYALLESIDIYIQNLESTNIIFRSSSSDFDKAYQQVAKKFPAFSFVKQSPQPESDFKALTLNAIKNSPENYLMFAVDDNIVTDYVDLKECAEAIETFNAYGFYLRLGKNINNPRRGELRYLPAFREPSASNMLQWYFSSSQFEWNYPNTVDMTIYRKQDVIETINQLHFRNPNTFEGSWCGRKPKHPIGLCFTHSKIINIPINRVQTVFPNPTMNYMTPTELLVVFNEGKKINLEPFHKYQNDNPFPHLIPEFIKR